MPNVSDTKYVCIIYLFAAFATILAAVCHPGSIILFKQSFTFISSKTYIYRPSSSTVLSWKLKDPFVIHFYFHLSHLFHVYF